MQSRAQPNPLGRDVQNVVSEAQELLKTVKDEGSTQMDNARARMAAQYDAAREKFGEIQAQVSEGAKYAVTHTDQFVHTNPWQAIGVAAAAGAIIGFLLARR